MNLHQLQQRNQELSILNAIAQDLNRMVELEHALDATLRQTVHLLQLRTGWIWLMNPDTGMAFIAAAYNLPPVFRQRPELLTGWCYCIEKYLTGNLENASNISEITCTRLKDLIEGTEGLRYHASVPLFGSKAKIGIMNVVSTDSQELSDEKLQLLYTIGDMLSIAVERARLFENSRQLGIVQERNRLAREIHDTLAQGLSGIALKLESIQAFLEKGNLDKVSALVGQTLKLTKSNIEEARRSVLDLRATPLQENNLIEAIEKMLKRLQQQEGRTGQFEVKGRYRPLGMRIELGLYRIVQEAVQNIVKHAQTEHFWLSLQYGDQQVQLRIQDRGVGFTPAADEKGLGLIGIRERVHILKGKLNIESEEGVGTTLTIQIPIDE